MTRLFEEIYQDKVKLSPSKKRKNCPCAALHLQFNSSSDPSETFPRACRNVRHSAGSLNK